MDLYATLPIELITKINGVYRDAVKDLLKQTDKPFTLKIWRENNEIGCYEHDCPLHECDVCPQPCNPCLRANEAIFYDCPITDWEWKNMDCYRHEKEQGYKKEMYSCNLCMTCYLERNSNLSDGELHSLLTL